MVRTAGLELARDCSRQILSLCNAVYSYRSQAHKKNIPKMNQKHRALRDWQVQSVKRTHS